MSDDRFDLRPEYFALARTLRAMLFDELGLARRDRPVIGIAGESGSGKSITATALAHELTNAGVPTAVLYQDDYFHRPPRTNHEHRVVDLAHVGPHEVNLDLIESHVDAFRARQNGVVAPRVDYPANAFVTFQLDFEPFAALIVEGTYVLRLPGLDARVFLEATHEDTREARRARARDIDDPIVDRVLAIEHDLIFPQRDLADVVVARDFAATRRA